MVELSAEEKAKFIEWIKANVDERVVPGDEGHGDALAFNLIYLIKLGPFFEEGGKFLDASRFKYLPEQEEEIESWGKDRVKW